MDYQYRQDLELIMELTDDSYEELAEVMDVSWLTVHNWVSGKVKMSRKNLEKFYAYAYGAGIRLNKIKEQLYRETVSGKTEHLLFHGAKTEILGAIDPAIGRETGDFGKGFYCGESLEQSAMFVSAFPSSSLYMMKFHAEGLKGKEYEVSTEWMLTIAYNRNTLEKNRNAAAIRAIIGEVKGLDYIVAPIADNRMFAIIDQFIEGELTDVQCKHCLAATDLGKQYVILSEKAARKVEILEKCYLTEKEKERYLASGRERFDVGRDKVKLARRKYANRGKYIEELLK